MNTIIDLDYKEQISELVSEYETIIQIVHELMFDINEADTIKHILALEKLLTHHFKHEEKLMLDINFYGIIEHKKNHDVILNRLNGIAISLMENTINLSELKRFLNYLMQRHFMGFDRKLNNFIKNSNNHKFFIPEEETVAMAS